MTEATTRSSIIASARELGHQLARLVWGAHMRQTRLSHAILATPQKIEWECLRGQMYIARYVQSAFEMRREGGELMIGTEVGGRELDNALEKFVVMNIEEMARPATEWEAKVLQQVLLLPQVTVTRPPEHELLNAGMTPHDCHANCASQEANDPQKEYRHVSGWYLNGSDLILHSVVEALGHWYCLTPQHISPPPRFQFIPDPLIEWTVDAASGTHEAFRDGVKLPLALRRFPEDHILMRDKFLALVAAGVSVLDARQEVEATLGAEIKTRRRSEGAA